MMASAGAAADEQHRDRRQASTADHGIVSRPRSPARGCGPAPRVHSARAARRSAPASTPPRDDPSSAAIARRVCGGGRFASRAPAGAPGPRGSSHPADAAHRARGRSRRGSRWPRRHCDRDRARSGNQLRLTAGKGFGGQHELGGANASASRRKSHRGRAGRARPLPRNVSRPRIWQAMAKEHDSDGKFLRLQHGGPARCGPPHSRAVRRARARGPAG